MKFRIGDRVRCPDGTIGVVVGVWLDYAPPSDRYGCEFADVRVPTHHRLGAQLSPWRETVRHPAAHLDPVPDESTPGTRSTPGANPAESRASP